VVTTTTTLMGDNGDGDENNGQCLR
jgi:hypothetical protein